jgi:hypothetical protein
MEKRTMMAEPTNATQPELKTVFFLVRTTASWLRLTPAERDRFVREVLRPILARHPETRLRYFDAEAYSADTTDVLMWQFRTERDYRALVEDLRETEFWGGYFEVREIVPCVEDDFARHYGVSGFAESQRDRHVPAQ